MKMKKIKLLFIGVISCITMSAQVSDYKLRFIAGFPDYNFVPEHDYLINVSAILTAEKDSLIEETLISDTLQRLDFLRCYPEYGMIIAMTKGKSGPYEIVPSLGYQITIIDTKTLEKNVYSIPESVNINGINYKFYSRAFSSVLEDNEWQFVLEYINFELPKKDGIIRKYYYLLNPKTQNLQKTEPAIYRKTIANSGNMVLANNYEGEILKGDTTTNILKIATSKFYGNPVYCDYLPSNVNISRKSYAAATVLINNDDMLVLYLYEREQRGKWIYCKVHVYDKQKKTWDNFELETSWVLAKYFDKYITGNYRVVQLTNKDNNFPFKEEYWIKEKTKYGPSYQDFFIEFPVFRYYSEGDLYLYSIKSKNMIKWNTGHGDSEVLLVQDDIVYYRVNDKIFKAPIIKGETLGEAKLLIQDERVPDIHWAFISKN